MLNWKVYNLMLRWSQFCKIAEDTERIKHAERTTTITANSAFSCLLPWNYSQTYRIL